MLVGLAPSGQCQRPFLDQDNPAKTHPLPLFKENYFKLLMNSSYVKSQTEFLGAIC